VLVVLMGLVYVVSVVVFGGVFLFEVYCLLVCVKVGVVGVKLKLMWLFYYLIMYVSLLFVVVVVDFFICF